MFKLMNQKKENFLNKFYGLFSPEEITKISRAFMTLIVSMESMQMYAMAGSMDNMFQDLIGTVCKVFFYIGAILLVWAIGQLVLAFKNEDADSKSRAVMVLVTAVLLMSIRTIYNTVTQNLSGRLQANEVSW